MRSRLALVAAALSCAAASLPAQTYIVEPGTLYTTSAVTQAALASQMIGMEVLVRFSDGTTSGGTWGFLFESGGQSFYGVRNGLFEMFMRGGADTGPPGLADELTLANVNPSEATLTGFLLRGAPAGVVFDRTFGGLTGTPGSGSGRDIFDKNNADSPGFDEYLITARYRNRVALAGNAPQLDLFESLDVTFGNPVPGEESYSLAFDTDLARGLAVVPEPGTWALVGAGLAGLAGLTRARRRNA